MFLPKGFQAFQMGRGNSCRGFYFYSDFGVADNRIHFISVVQCVPERKPFFRFGVIEKCYKLLKDEVFKSMAVLCRPSVECVPMQKKVCNAHIKIVEFFELFFGVLLQILSQNLK